MLKKHDINPNIGLGELTFGIAIDEFIEQFGQAEDMDTIEEDEQMNTTLLHYWKGGFSVFFVGLANQILAGIETDHPDTTLFGSKIMGLTEAELIALLKNNGHSTFEREVEENDIRLSYDFSMMDFFFREGKLIYMNFGVFVDEDGDIERV
ncbi:MAG: hypothetical protein DRI89_00500 [Bacteroidetes bacterium]|nr:MAG: hypothetical protein DRI89_00500 [Bacteroidota bacterium]